MVKSISGDDSGSTAKQPNVQHLLWIVLISGVDATAVRLEENIKISTIFNRQQNTPTDITHLVRYLHLWVCWFLKAKKWSLHAHNLLELMCKCVPSDPEQRSSGEILPF